MKSDGERGSSKLPYPAQTLKSNRNPTWDLTRNVSRAPKTVKR